MPGLLRNASFRKLFAGQAISQIGSRITREGLPITAVVLLGASPLEMGILSGASAAAVLLLGLFAGAFADRVRRRPIMIATDLGRAAVLATIPLAALAGRLSFTHLLLVSAVAGILSVLFDVSYQAYVPSLLEGGTLVEANSRLALSESIAEVAGPPLAGVLVQTLTAPIAIAFDACSFLVSAASLAWIRAPEPKPRRDSLGASEQHIVREILEGLRFSWGDGRLRALLIASGVRAFFGGFQGALYMVFALRVLHLTPAVLGLLIAVGGGSAIVGSLSAPALVRRWGYGNSLIGAVALGAVAAFLIPMAHGPLWVATAFLAASQAGDATWPISEINQLSIRQSLAPAHLLGRVNSAAQLTFRGGLPAGALAGGILAELIGIRPTMVVSATGALLSMAVLLGSPVRNLRLSTGAENSTM